MTTDARRCPVPGCGGKLVPMKGWAGASGFDDESQRPWECDSPFCVYWETRQVGPGGKA